MFKFIVQKDLLWPKQFTDNFPKCLGDNQDVYLTDLCVPFHQQWSSEVSIRCHFCYCKCFRSNFCRPTTPGKVSCCSMFSLFVKESQSLRNGHVTFSKETLLFICS
ncbi:hypothetical protein GOODEAATRI_009673 [Goodea atripinnis]|uniref:Uncharacterized protein n=1 Tax=Goodea atripinnis TaxID=208336 RepID=A0ABV0MQR8_9TELE